MDREAEQGQVVRGDPAGRPGREPEEGPLLRPGGQPGQVPLRLVEPARSRSPVRWLMLSSSLSTPRCGRPRLRSPGRGPREFQGFSGARKPLTGREIESGRVTDRPSLLEFGPFRLDARRRLVWRGEALLEVPPKAVELLAALAGEAGEVVPKEELLRRVWPDTFVEEANLSVNVSILRKALGDQPDGRPWIQTVARRGYRFLGAVRAPAPRPRAASPSCPSARSGGDGGRPRARPRDGRRAHHPPRRDRPRRGAPHRAPSAASRRLDVDPVGRRPAARGRRGPRRAAPAVRRRACASPCSSSRRRAARPSGRSSFDEEITHLFAVEDKVAERVAAALVAELSAEERQRLGRRQTESLEAYQAYCRGRYFWGRFSRPWVEKAMLCFHEATAHDPRYALPHAGLADAFLVAGFAGALPPREAWALAAESSRQALALDDGSPSPTSRPGFLRLLQDWDWDGRRARAAPRRRARPPSPPPRTSGSASSSTCGAAATRRRAPCAGRRSSTRCRWWSRALVGLHHAFGGDHEAELAQARRTLELDPPPVPRPLGRGRRPAEPRASRGGGGRAPAGPRPRRGHAPS